MFPKSREKEERFRDFNSDRARVQVGVKNIDKICRRHLSMALMMERLTESAKLASSEPKSISLLVTINLLFLSSLPPSLRSFSFAIWNVPHVGAAFSRVERASLASRNCCPNSLFRAGGEARFGSWRLIYTTRLSCSLTRFGW